MISARGRYAVRVVLTLLVLVSTLLFARSVFFHKAAGSSPFFWLSLGSTAILLLRVRPFLSEAGLLLLGTGVLLSVGQWPATLAWWLILTFSCLGLGSLATIAIRTIWAAGTERKILYGALAAGVLLFGLGWVTMPILLLGTFLRPKALDLFLYSFDCSLRIQPSFFMGVLFWKWHWLERISVLCYLGISIPVMTVYAATLARRRDRALAVLSAFLFSCVLVLPVYDLFPALGPRYLFGSNFPFHPLSIAQAKHLFLEPVALGGFRNAMPSMHLGWVLLAWWYSRGFSWWTRGVTLAFVMFTVAATLGMGEHYLIDLIVAFPFCLLLFAVFSFSLPKKHKEKVRALWLGALGTFGWFGLLRYAPRLFWVSPVIPWLFVAATLVAVTVQKDRLIRAMDMASSAAGPLPIPADSAGTRTSRRADCREAADPAPQRAGLL
jgi:hypothetical protein